MELQAAAHGVLESLARHHNVWAEWAPVHAFQLAYNARIPVFTGSPVLKPDGIYGPATARAMGETIAWFDAQGTWTSPTHAIAPTTTSGVAEDLAHATQALATAAAGGALPPAAPTKAFQRAYNATLQADAMPERLRMDGMCDLATQQKATALVDGGAAEDWPSGAKLAGLARQLLTAIAALPADHAQSPDWWRSVTGPCLAFQRAFNASVAELVRQESLNTVGVYDVLTASALSRAVAHFTWTASTATGFDPSTMGPLLFGGLLGAVLGALYERHHGEPTHTTSGFNLGHIVSEGLSAVEGVASMIPGIGTGISAALGAAQGVLDGGQPVDIAIHTAYAAIPIPDGIRQKTDPIVDGVIELAKTRPLTDATIYAARDKVPAGLARQVFDTLVHVAVKKVPVQKKPAEVQSHFVHKYAGRRPGVPAGKRPAAPRVPGAVAQKLAQVPASTSQIPATLHPKPPPPRPPRLTAAPTVQLAPKDTTSPPPTSPAPEPSP